MEFEDNEILTEEQVYNLFSDDGDSDTNKENTENQQDNKNKETTEEKEEPLDLSNLFSDTPESVGSEDNNKEDNKPSSKGKSSPKNVLSSLAKSLNEEGIIDLDEEDYDKIKSPEDFRDMFSKVIEKKVQSQFDERQKRIDEALNNNVDSNVIKNYENTIHQLNSITVELLSAENEQAEALRKNLIKQDYLNKGFSQEKAERFASKSVSEGTDIDDAKEALQSIKESVSAQYNKIQEDARQAENAYNESMKNQATTLRKQVLEEPKVFGDLELDKNTRQKVLDNLVKTVYKDPETGLTYTAIQKYEKENKIDFLRNIGILFTLTDGFKNLDNLVKSKVKKEVKQGLKELEQTLNNTARNEDGSLNFMSGTDDENSSFRDFTLDI